MSRTKTTDDLRKLDIAGQVIAELFDWLTLRHDFSDLLDIRQTGDSAKRS